MALQLTKSIFVHVPKTGGSWVRCALRNAGFIKKEFGEWHAMRKDFVTEMKCFGFVRHPLTWLQSRWAYAMQHRDREFKDRLLVTCFDLNFDQFIYNYLKKQAGFAGRVMTARTKGCDYIGRNEDLPFGLITALDYCDEPISQEQKMYIVATKPEKVASRSKEYKDLCVYDSDLAVLVYHAELEFCRVHNYHLEDVT